MKRQLSLFASFLLLTVGSVYPQTASEPNQGLKLRYEKATDPEERSLWDLSWWGRSNWTYFVQHSLDLVNWEYLPTIAFGDGAPLGYQWADERDIDGFLRLQIWNGYVSDPFNDDFDEDKVSNYEEVYRYGTDPLVKQDSDGDGLPDNWETKYFGSATAGAPDAHDDADTLTNLEEYILNTNPKAADTDGDGLSDSDEINQHFANPLLADTDGDGLNDGAEITTGTDPNWVDSDGDGATDGAEAAVGTDALDDQKYPPVWRSYERGLVYEFNDYPSSSPTPDEGFRHVYHSGNYAGTTTDLSTRLHLTALAGYLPAFPAAPGANAVPGWSAADVDAWVGGPPGGTNCDHATLRQQRIWLCVQPAATVDIVRPVPVLRERYVNGSPEPPEVRMETVTIPAGQTHSNPIDLAPVLTVDPPFDVLYHEEWADERNFDVEILIPDLEKASDGTEHFRFQGKERKLTAAKQLAIATLENSFDETKTSKPLKQDPTKKEDWISEDPDSFYIRVSEPALSGTGPLRARVWTDSEGTAYDDDARSTANSEVVELYEGATGIFTSDSMLLMSNEDDDIHPVGGVSDNQLNDRTRIIALGGSLKVEFLPAGQSPTYKPSAEVQVPVLKTVNIVPIVPIVSGTPVVGEPVVAADLKTLRETFAQCGIRITNGSVVSFNHTAAGINLSDGLETNQQPGNLTTEEQELFLYINQQGYRTANDITVVYVSTLTRPILGSVPSQSYPEKLAATPKTTNANHVVLRANRDPFAPPHELLHILLDASHYSGAEDYRDEFKHIRMTWSGGSADREILDRKRITKRTEGRQATQFKSKFLQ